MRVFSSIYSSILSSVTARVERVGRGGGYRTNPRFCELDARTCGILGVLESIWARG